METICGIHSVEEAIKSARRPVEHVHFQQGTRNPRLAKLVDLCRERGISIRFDPAAALDRLSQRENHQGVVAVVGGAQYEDIDAVLDRNPVNALLLALDGVQDVHNLGALIRTACAAGADAVIIPERRSAGLTPAVVKAASGAVEYLPVCRVGNLAQTLESLKKRNFWVFGLDERGEKDYDKADFGGNCVIVAGSEATGLHELLKKKCDFLLRIPAPGKISTLNVSVAAGIVLFEVSRQRRKAQPK